jgi:RoxA-like, cytochrome c-like
MTSSPRVRERENHRAEKAEVTMRKFDRVVRCCSVLMLAASMAVVREGGAQPAPAPTAPVVSYAEQGWTPADRDIFYTTGQGSLMMPYAWFKALRRLDVDEPFGADQLQRYGYLPNAPSTRNPEGLPVGFVIDGNPTTGVLGMSCAACHTAQLEYQKDGVLHALRLDGAPANADFQSFLIDLTAAARATLNEPARFAAFAKTVLGSGHSQAQADRLKKSFGDWVGQFGEFMDLSLPPSPWGPGRLDAFGMIFNRVAGRDLGIKENFKVADAPVSYPFLWNASRQDRTQWNGGVPNGLFIQGLARNTGEVFGVFANLKPSRRLPGVTPPLIWYGDNSAHLAGLQTLEEQIVKLRPPPWPRELFGLDEALATRGETLFNEHCLKCHSDKPSDRVLGAWDTPVVAVGTDPKMVKNAGRKVDPGILKGALVPSPPIGLKLESQSEAPDVLAVAVIGTLIDAFRGTPSQQQGVWRALRADADKIGEVKPRDLLRIPDIIKSKLSGLFRNQASEDSAAYESRSLHGIWATAPYLHNGSVPNLWELLMPPSQRKSTFAVGSRVFDPKNVGYATDQSPFKNATFVTDPANANGNGNGGHVYGTSLTEDERWAIIEYLKKH